MVNQPIQGMFPPKMQAEAWLQILIFGRSKGKRGMYDLVSRCFIVLGWEVAYLLKIMCGQKKTYARRGAFWRLPYVTSDQRLPMHNL